MECLFRHTHTATYRTQNSKHVLLRLGCRSGQLRPGDEVLEVNGLKLKGKSVHDICDTLCQVDKMIWKMRNSSLYVRTFSV